jgi:hypothetical protein
VLEGRVLVVIGRPTGRARLLGVGDAYARVVCRPRPFDWVAGAVPATHDRLLPVVRLLEQCNVGPLCHSGRDPAALSVHNLCAHGAGGKETAHGAAVLFDPGLHRVELVVSAKIGTASAADGVVCDHDRAVIVAYHP